MIYLQDEDATNCWVGMLAGYVQRLVEEKPFEAVSPVAGTRYHQIEERVPHYSLREALTQNLNMAVEHLTSVNLLLLGARSLPSFSLFTLCRASLESLAQGMWVLAGKTQNEIITRMLRIHSYGYVRQGNAEPYFGADRSSVLSKENVEFAAKCAGISESDQAKVQKPRIKSSEMMKAAEKDFKMSAMYALWQVASGVAHGLMWGVQMVTDTEEIEGSRDEYGALYTLQANTVRVSQLLYEVVFGYLLLRDVYRERSQGQYRPIEDVRAEVEQHLKQQYWRYLIQHPRS